jgi:deoxyadenosine/deoxycytidine kinase
MKISDMSYVVVEGPIGVGKTTLANKLALEWDAELLLEKVENNPFLEKFYDNPEQLALATQLYFLLIRSRQIQAINQQSIFSNIRVSDFMPQKDRLFAQNNLTKDELDLYEQIYAYLTSSLPSPDLVIYLQAPTSIFLKNLWTLNI